MRMRFYISIEAQFDMDKHSLNQPRGGHTGSFCGRTRREFLWEIGGGFGSVALSGFWVATVLSLGRRSGPTA